MAHNASRVKIQRVLIFITLSPLHPCDIAITRGDLFVLMRRFALVYRVRIVRLTTLVLLVFVRVRGGELNAQRLCFTSSTQHNA